jgi:hypothetical protein
MSRIKEEIEKYKREHNIGNNAPPDRDILQSLDINEDKTTVMDANGKELCRFYIEIDGRKLFFKFPIFDKYDLFQKKLAELTIYLSKAVGEVEITPNNVEIFNNPIAKSLWQEAAGYAVAGSKRVRELVIDIFFNTLSGYVDEIVCHKRIWETEQYYNDRVTKRHLKWFMQHVTVDKLQHIFHCCYAVDELIKVNATQGNIKKKLPHLLQAQSSKNISAKNPGSAPKSSAPTQLSSLKPL